MRGIKDKFSNLAVLVIGICEKKNPKPEHSQRG